MHKRLFMHKTVHKNHWCTIQIFNGEAADLTDVCVFLTKMN